MASFFATVAFDLKDASSADYECAEKNLRAVGLYKTLKADNGNSVELPYNTFAGTFNGETAGAVRDYVREQSKAALNKCRLTGRLFVAVGGDWSWGSTTF